MLCHDHHVEALVQLVVDSIVRLHVLVAVLYELLFEPLDPVHDCLFLLQVPEASCLLPQIPELDVVRLAVHLVCLHAFQKPCRVVWLDNVGCAFHQL